MMTSAIQKIPGPAYPSTPVIPPSVLLIGKKRALDYIAPALLRLNNTGELVIKATGSLSIVTAVDVAEIVKRDLDNVATNSINLGTDAFIISTGETKRMSCIEIRLAKTQTLPDVPVTKVVDIVAAPPSEIMLAKLDPVLQVPAARVVETVTAPTVGSTLIVVKRRAVRKSNSAPKRKKVLRKKRSSSKK